jgi:hypothetical protein
VSQGEQVVKSAEELAESIDTGIINKQRRYFLIGATAAVGAIGVVGAAVPFVASGSPAPEPEPSAPRSRWTSASSNPAR